MKTNRSLLVLILPSIITFGIYPLFFWSSYAKDMNTACYGDGKHTRGIFARIIFSMLTFGIYELVWMYKTAERISFNAHQKGIHCNATGTSVLLWYILGSFIIVGPFVAMAQLINGLNSLCAAHNAGARQSAANINININR